MLDTVFGLPTHVLVVHLAVVLIPLAALATVAAAGAAIFRRRTAASAMWWVALADLATVAVAFVAKQSGERLSRRLFPDGHRPTAVTTHVHRGGNLFWYTLGLTAVTWALAMIIGNTRPAPERLPRLRMPHLSVPTPAVAATAVLAIAAGVAVTVEVILVGHSGSAAVWQGVVQNTR